MNKAEALKPKNLVVCSFGGGTNSTAMLIGMVERGERVDLILFADTGGEKPHTYAHIIEMSKWLVAHGMPAVVTVRAQAKSRYGSLENFVLKHKTLPSIAFGYKSCSMQFKIEPINDYLKTQNIKNPLRIVGFDAGEPHRAKYGVDDKMNSRYPLIEWNWGRDECIDAIKRAGLALPGKSACFFCPSSKKQEIMQLKRDYPDLAARAVTIENNAELTHIKGLGRDFAWRDLLAWNEAQIDMFPHESRIEIDCGCYDEAQT